MPPFYRDWRGLATASKEVSEVAPHRFRHRPFRLRPGDLVIDLEVVAVPPPQLLVVERAGVADPKYTHILKVTPDTGVGRHGGYRRVVATGGNI